MALTLTRRQLTNDLTEVGETGPKSCKFFLWIVMVTRTYLKSVLRPKQAVDTQCFRTEEE